VKVTACVQISALRDTLAEKQVTKILKFFSISAASCMSFQHTALERAQIVLS